MASTKEAICICMDVGMSMKSQIVETSEDGQSSETTYFKRAVSLFTKLIERKVFSESKDEVCVVLFGTDETNNKLAKEMDGQYRHVTSLCRLRSPSFELIEMINEISPSDQSEADFLDAVVVGLDLLHACSEGKKFARQRVFLFSAFLSNFDDEASGIEDIKKTLASVNAELSVIGLDDMGQIDAERENGRNDLRESTPSSSVPSTSRTSLRPESNKLLADTQRRAIAVMSKIHEAVEGSFYSFSDVTQVLQFFLSRESKISAWNVNLELGSTQIPVTRFIRVKEAKIKTWKKFGPEDADVREAPAALRTTRTHYVITSDSDVPKRDDNSTDDDIIIRGEEKEVDADQLVKGYRYGSTLIPVTEADEEQMKLTDNAKCLRVVGFAKREQVSLSDAVGDGSWVFVAQEANNTAALAVSALVKACISSNRIIVARYAYSRASNPRLVALIPRSETLGHNRLAEYLVGVQLPFADDLRMFTLPSFDAITAEQLRPNEEQQRAMDQLVASARLDSEELNDYELYQPGSSFNPYLQRIYQCLSHKRLYPDKDLPDVDKAIISSLESHPSIVFGAAASIDEMDSLFETKVVEKTKPSTGQTLFLKKLSADKNGTEVFNGGSDEKYAKLENVQSLNDVTSKNNGENISSISSKNPSEDFKKLLESRESSNQEESILDYSSECKKCEDKAIEFITNSFNNEFFGKAHELILVYRSEAIKRGFVSSFNSFLISLRELLKSRRKEQFLDVLKQAKTTLINDHESDLSNISILEASAFNDGDALNTSSVPNGDSLADVTDENYDDASDLLAQLD